MDIIFYFLYLIHVHIPEDTVFLEFDININVTTFYVGLFTKSEKSSRLHLIRPMHFFGLTELIKIFEGISCARHSRR